MTALSRFRFLSLAASGLLLASFAAAPLAHAQDVTAAVPHDVSVTVYRDPYRGQGGFDLNYLNGFAFITETRRVVIEPGTHRLRFEGVSDGIDPATAIVTGLPSGVIEKNRDAALLSPLALVNAAQEQGGRVQLVRTDPATGTGSVTSAPVKIRARPVLTVERRDVAARGGRDVDAVQPKLPSALTPGRGALPGPRGSGACVPR